MLINGDCLEELKQIDDNSVDLVFCDLPYGQTRCKWDKKIDLNKLWKELKRVRKDKCLVFFTTTTKYGIDLIMSNRKEFRYDLVWIKSAPCGFLSARKMPMRQHEMLYCFAKNGYTKEGAYDISSHTFKNLKKKNGMIGTEGVIYGKEVKQVYNKKYDPPLPTSVLTMKSTKGKHRTEKPVNLMKWILKYFSKEGSVVLDPTMGSGSMGVACKEMNRNFIGIEMDKKIFEVAKQRLDYS